MQTENGTVDQQETPAEPQTQNEGCMSAAPICRTNAERDSAIHLLRQAGWTYAAIAAKYGLGKARVSVIAYKMEHPNVTPFGLSVRASTALSAEFRCHGKTSASLSIGDISAMSYPNLLKIACLGKVCADEIAAMLWRHGIAMSGLPKRLLRDFGADGQNSSAAPLNIGGATQTANLDASSDKLPSLRKGSGALHRAATKTGKKAERNAEMFELYRAGWTYSDLARKYGVTPARARDIVHHYPLRVELFRGLSARTLNILGREFDVWRDSDARPSIEDVAKLSYQYLVDIPNAGTVTVNEIAALLWRHGIKMRGLPPKLLREFEAEGPASLAAQLPARAALG